MVKILLLVATLSSAVYPTKEELTSIYNVIKYVETNNNPRAVGDDGKAYGIVQIHWVCIKDVNKTFNTDFKHRDAFKEEYAKEIFNLYIHKGVRLFRKKYCRDPTEQEIVRMWNGGIYRGYLYKATVKYYNRYLYFKKKKVRVTTTPISIKPRGVVCHVVSNNVVYSRNNIIKTLLR